MERASLARPSSSCCGSGGAIPYSRNRFLPRAVIQSVVQAGESCISTRSLSMPRSFRARRISFLMTVIAGHPEYVGVTVTTKTDSDLCALCASVVKSGLSSIQLTSRTIPKSTTERMGISGSQTESNQAQISSREGKLVFIQVTIGLEDKRAARIAFLPTNTPAPRCESLVYRRSASNSIPGPEA